MGIKEWVEEERPRELLLANGAENLALAKLIAIILRTGERGVSAEELARSILNKYHSLRALEQAPIEELLEIPGIGPAKIAQLKSAFELGRRLYREETKMTPAINFPEDAIQYVQKKIGTYLRDAPQEYFYIILLNIRNRIIKDIEINKGTLTSSIVDIQQIMREALQSKSAAMILVHNHPSGDTNPSKEDIRLTQQIIEAGKLLNLQILDHIIIGNDPHAYYSFKKNHHIE